MRLTALNLPMRGCVSSSSPKRLPGTRVGTHAGLRWLSSSMPLYRFFTPHPGPGPGYTCLPRLLPTHLNRRLTSGRQCAGPVGAGPFVGQVPVCPTPLPRADGYDTYPTLPHAPSNATPRTAPAALLPRAPPPPPPVVVWTDAQYTVALCVERLAGYAPGAVLDCSDMGRHYQFCRHLIPPD